MCYCSDIFFSPVWIAVYAVQVNCGSHKMNINDHSFMHSVFINWLSRWRVLKKSNVCLFIIQTSGLHCTKKNCQNFFYLLSTLVDCRWGSVVARQICRQYSNSVFLSDESPFVSVQLWTGITAGLGGGGASYTRYTVSLQRVKRKERGIEHPNHLTPRF